jgi:hypothetical protein
MQKTKTRKSKRRGKPKAHQNPARLGSVKVIELTPPAQIVHTETPPPRPPQQTTDKILALHSKILCPLELAGLCGVSGSRRRTGGFHWFQEASE